MGSHAHIVKYGILFTKSNGKFAPHRKFTMTLLVTGNTVLATTTTIDKNPYFPLFFQANCISGTNPIPPFE
jgi:predicted NAD-dependent protein-ADP-ribosyltransferase YbiA (DUF1768 family)